MFPTIGHTHRSYWRNGDTTAHLDVRPWPIAQRFVLRRSKVHILHSGGASQFQNMAREAVQLQSQLNAVAELCYPGECDSDCEYSILRFRQKRL